jgi:hypothetical protein
VDKIGENLYPSVITKDVMSYQATCSGIERSEMIISREESQGVWQ